MCISMATMDNSVIPAGVKAHKKPIRFRIHGYLGGHGSVLIQNIAGKHTGLSAATKRLYTAKAQAEAVVL
ncbi:hypothetical protein SDC9_205082 [bioreactor metagenome]|uniref:Uncharacterized protein n=1 Tax=bioreactor metagenome TaxID=1076179 RepID=A0A645J127_9ZZZZ